MNELEGLVRCSNILRVNFIDPFVRLIRSHTWLSFLSGIALAAGFLRELVVAREYGISAELDLFVAVLGIYLFLGVQVGNTMETTLISYWKRVPTEPERRDLIRSVLLQLIVLIGLSLAVVLFSFDVWFTALFPTLGHDATAASLMYVLSIAVVCASITGLLRGALNSLHIFAPGIVSGAIISVCSIASVLIISRDIGIYALAVGVVIGNTLLLLWYAFLLAKHGLLSFEPIKPKGVVLPYWTAALVVLIGEVLFQIYGITERSIAAQTGVGTISAFFYAATVMLVPVTLVVTPLLTTLYPRLVTAIAQDHVTGARLFTRYAIVVGIFCSVAALVFAVFAQELVEVLFVRGAFTHEAAIKTSGILSILSVSLPFLAIGRLVRYALFAMSDYVTSAVGNALSIVLLLFLGWLFVPTYGVPALAGATVTATALGTLLTYAILLRKLRNA
jgi:putative peptidoglycan lipid II flippase